MSIITCAVNGALVDTTIITVSHTMASTGYTLNALCLHPTSTSKIYATTNNKILEFDWTGNSEIAVVDDVAGMSNTG